MRKCRTCHGEYEPIQRDGTRYFHVCPPLVELVDKDGLVVTPAEARLIEAAGGSVRELTRPRPNARDENLVLDVRRGAMVPKAGGDEFDELDEVKR